LSSLDQRFLSALALSANAGAESELSLDTAETSLIYLNCDAILGVQDLANAVTVVSDTAVRRVLFQYLPEF
jgi:hypothetical protein